MAKTIFTIFSIIMLVLIPMFSFVPLAKADANSMLWGGHEQNVQVATGLGNTDPRTMAGSVLKVLLGFLGIIAVLLILYGGFKWMTAAGDEGNVDTAKKIISAGVIGLVIILAAFGVSQFVMSAIYNATGATG